MINSRLNERFQYNGILLISEKAISYCENCYFYVNRIPCGTTTNFFAYCNSKPYIIFKDI